MEEPSQGSAVINTHSGLGKPWLFSDSEPLSTLAASWEMLDSVHHVPTGSHAWAASCAEAFSDGDTPFVAAVREHDGLAAAVLLSRPRGVLSPLRQPGVQELGEPTDFSYRHAAALTPLLAALAQRGESLRLHRLPAESPVIEAVRAAYRHRGLVLQRPKGGCPYIPLEGPDGVEALLSSRLRSDLRRARRRAEQLGPVSSEVHTPTSREALQPLLHEALGVEHASWKGERGSSLCSDVTRRRFFEAYGTRLLPQRSFKVCLLHVAGQPVAMQIAVEAEQRFWLLKIGYNARYHHCSPGMLLMLETLRYAAAQRLRSYEFLGEAAPWTRRWTGREHPTVELRAYALNHRGVSLLLRDAAATAWRGVRALWRRR